MSPSRCALCGIIGQDPVCRLCEGEFPWMPTTVDFAEDDPLDFHAAPYFYSGRAEQAIKALKFSRLTAVGSHLGDLVRNFAQDRGLLDGVTLIPVPIHWRRLFFRGFNQSALLAESLNVPRLDMDGLIRVRHTKPQSQLNAEKRKTNLDGAFECTRGFLGERVLLLDDVLTSGSTARECAKRLKAAGATWVGVLTVTWA